MPEIEMPGGLKVETFEPPPAGFDPFTASDSLLHHYGYLPRPDIQVAPEQYEWWKELVLREGNYIVPRFERIEGVQHGPRLPAAETNTSNNWSGSVVQVPNAGDHFFRAEGYWTVPHPYAAGQGEFYSSQWVGIDGDGSGDVLQVGTETDAANSGSNSWDCYAWWEWVPTYPSEIKISNFPVSPGDIMSCYVYAYNPYIAQVYLYNRSNGSVTYFNIAAMPPNVLVGNCAEWIVERPTVNGSLPHLAKCSAIYFDTCNATYLDSNNMPHSTTSGSGTLVNMTGDNNAVLSRPTNEAAHLMSVWWRKAF